MSSTERQGSTSILSGWLGMRLSVKANDWQALEEVPERLAALGVTHVRLELDCEQWRNAEIRRWYDQMLARLRDCAQVCAALAPGRNPKSGAAELRETVDQLLNDHAAVIYAVELPLTSWEQRLGENWPGVCRELAASVRAAGTTYVLNDAHWQEASCVQRCKDNGALQSADAIAVEMTLGEHDHGVAEQLRRIAQALRAAGLPRPIWLSGLQRNWAAPKPYLDLAVLVDAVSGHAQRVYWHADNFTKAGPARFLAQGREQLHRLAGASSRPGARGEPVQQTLITGGAGFVGANLAERILRQGERVIIYDNLSRPGTERNLHWLKDRHGDLVTFYYADIRDSDSLALAVEQANCVFHFAGQVAVTSSLEDPLYDHQVNALGTLTLLEVLRGRKQRPPLIFTSTNKVYGALQDVPLQVTQSRYEPIHAHVRKHGIDENRPLEFCSPYGCSKGAADQYVLDYCKTFEIPTVCFRMSCIYGRRQFGNEDQGWVAHFIKQAVTGDSITVFGDGLQVRDVLFADDLVEAFLKAREHMPALRGQVFNIGGGPDNVLSLVELLVMIECLDGRAPLTRFESWRPSDQRYYVSNFGKFNRATGWRPHISIPTGVQRLYQWMAEEYGTDHNRGQRQAAL